ncbi:hypothetical protein LCGC14_2195960, partial [marine sediment metagenome]
WGTVEKLAAGDKPLNVLLIMSDQHNVRAMGCSGNLEIKTPAMDRLAAEGVRFSSATCQTGQCCPSRATLFTGRYAHSHGLRWNGVTDPVAEVYYPELFREAGYATCSIGKHHMFVPLDKNGFDHDISMGKYNRFCRSQGKPNWLGSGKWQPYRISGPVGASAADNDHHPTGYWANEMIKWLRANKDKPFCGVLSFYGPHTPICPSRPWADMYDPAKLTLPGNFDVKRNDWPVAMASQRRQVAKLTPADHRRVLAYYYGLTSQIDHNISRVLAELDALGLKDNTLVIYTADHGEMMAEQRCWTKTVACPEATIRVPMIARLPGAIPAGKVRDELVGLVDLAPTVLTAAGLKTPPKVQGESMLPLMKGKDVAWRKTVFSEIGYPGKHHGRCVMARTHKHKLIHNPNLRAEGPIDELFDLAGPMGDDQPDRQSQVCGDRCRLEEAVGRLGQDHRPRADVPDHPRGQAQTPKPPPPPRPGQMTAAGVLGPERQRTMRC